MTCGRIVSLIAIGVLSGAAASAQPSGYLYGRILDPSDAAVAEAAITVLNEDSGFRRTMESQSDGVYSVGSLAPGSYKITVRKEGFRTVIRFHVRVDRNETTRVDFALTLGSMQETITVEGTTSIVQRDEASVATNLVHEEIDKLPLNGRGLFGLMELAPGTNIVPATRGDAGQFVTDGQRPNTNYFAVDGVSANNGVSAGGLPAQAAGGALPVLSAFGSLDALISLDAVQDFQIQTSSTGSDFGWLPGASIAITSRSGSDELHGSGAFSFRDELLGANDWFANRAGEPRAALREENEAATLGGPLRRNRTFFFLSFERMDLRQPFAWYEAVPSIRARKSASAWAQPALALFPNPNGPELGNGLAVWNGRDSRPAGLEAGSVRVDHMLTKRISWFGRYSDSPSNEQFGDIQINRLDFRSWSGTIGLNARLGPEASFDFRLNESVTSAQSVWSGNSGCELLPVAAQFLPAPTCGLLVRFQIDGVGQLVSGSEGERRQRQFQIAQSASWKHGGHTLQAGVDYRRIVPVRRDAYGTLSLIADDIPSLDNRGNLWIAQSSPMSASTEVGEFSAWTRDTWKVTPRLTLTGGLRWEFSPAPTNPGGENFLTATNTVLKYVRPLWPGPYGHFAPRLGVAFSPDKSGRTVLRAGAGLYFDSSLSIATDALNAGPWSVDFFHSGRFGLFSGLLSYGFMPDLVLPRVKQWNFSVEHALSANDVVSIGYVGSAGRDLIRREVGGPGSSLTAWVALTTNHGASDYQAFVAQYHRHLAHGLEALVAYSWSHSLDDDSSDTFLLWTGAGSPAARDHASSDFDLRHSLTASFSYALPGPAKGWSLDGILRARSGFPITVLSTDQYTGIGFMNAFRPNLAPNVPVWVPDSSAPGGRSLNPQAFQAAAGGQQGNLGRNALTGFGMSQIDLAVRREFRVADRRTLELRVEAFNALNQANLADPVRYLNSPFFGQSTSMLNLMLGTGSSGSGLAPLLESGGPRSVEAVLRFRF
jgi:hypothetical protein